MDLMTKIILSVLLTSAAAQASATCASLDSVRWMLGDWSAEWSGRTVTESWTEVSPGTFEGAGVRHARGARDPEFKESLRLVEMSGEVFYLAKVEHNDLPIAFKLTGCTLGLAVFENPGHDFPRRLEYRLETDGSMVVAVGDGRERGFEIRFTHRDQ